MLTLPIEFLNIYSMENVDMYENGKQNLKCMFSNNIFAVLLQNI